MWPNTVQCVLLTSSLAPPRSRVDPRRQPAVPSYGGDVAFVEFVSSASASSGLSLAVCAYAHFAASKSQATTTRTALHASRPLCLAMSKRQREPVRVAACKVAHFPALPFARGYLVGLRNDWRGRACAGEGEGRGDLEERRRVPSGGWARGKGLPRLGLGRGGWEHLAGSRVPNTGNTPHIKTTCPLSASRSCLAYSPRTPCSQTRTTTRSRRVRAMLTLCTKEGKDVDVHQQRARRRRTPTASNRRLHIKAHTNGHQKALPGYQPESSSLAPKSLHIQKMERVPL